MVELKPKLELIRRAISFGTVVQPTWTFQTETLELGIKSDAELSLRRAKSSGPWRAIGPLKKSRSLPSSLPSTRRYAYTDFLYPEVEKEESEECDHPIDVGNTSGEVPVDSNDLKAASLRKTYSLIKPGITVSYGNLHSRGGNLWRRFASLDPPQFEKSRLAVLLLDQDPFSVYKRLFLMSTASNLILLIVAASGHYEYAKNNGALFALANVLMLVLVRNEVFLRFVFWLTVLLFGHSNVPLRLKNWSTHALQNLGGIHSGCGVASLVWDLYAIIQLFHHRKLVPESTKTLLMLVFFLLLISSLAACPLLRHVHHNYFETTHRICGWAALVLIWCFVLLSASYDPSTNAYHLTAKKVVHRTDIWFAGLLTILVFLPWVLIRKVPVRTCTPSDAVILITFPDGLPVGVFGRISRSPFSDWHAFGTASDGVSENTMICGAVGDFTKGLLSNPPTHLWTRQVRFAGVAYLANMYRRAVFVATGSGIGPFLSFLMQPSKVEVHLIWIAKDINKSYGKFVSDIYDRFPKDKLIFHDTALLGRPNVEKLVVDKVRECGAELVIVTSNPAGSKRVIDSCTAAGIAAFGPVWDS